MNQSIKFYEFATESKFNRGVDAFFSYIIFTFSPLAIYLLLKYFFCEIFNISTVSHSLNKVLICVCLVIGIFLSVLYIKSTKGVLLYDCYLKIETQFVLKHYFLKINPKIFYSEIKSVQIESKTSDSYQKWNEKHLYFVAGYYSKTKSYIRVETVTDCIYCFCVRNQEQFVEELIDRVNNYRRKHNMEEL